MNNPTDHPSAFVLEVGRYTRKSDFFFPYEYGLPYLISLSKWVVEKTTRLWIEAVAQRFTMKNFLIPQSMDRLMSLQP